MAPSNVEPTMLALLQRHCRHLGSTFTSRGSNIVLVQDENVTTSSSSSSRALFAKHAKLPPSNAPSSATRRPSSSRAVDQVLGEAASLHALQLASRTAGHDPNNLVPTVHAWGTDEEAGAAFLVTDHCDIRAGLSASAQSELGTKLAEMHRQALGEERRYGFAKPTHCGETEQDNTWHSSWPDFWAQRRIGDLVRRIGDAEITRLEAQMRKKVYPLIFKPILEDPSRIWPAIIHGDLWSGNAGMDERSGHPIIFDPSSYYAHNEAELGIMHMFGGFGSPFFDAYHKVVGVCAPSGHWTRSPPVPLIVLNHLYVMSQIPKLEPYYSERILNYELYHHLNHTLIFGGGYRSGAVRIMKKLVAWAESEEAPAGASGKKSELELGGEVQLCGPSRPGRARLARQSAPTLGRWLPQLLSCCLVAWILLAPRVARAQLPIPARQGEPATAASAGSRLAAAASEKRNEASDETYEERLTLRTLQDGRTHAIFEFRVDSSASPFPSSRRPRDGGNGSNSSGWTSSQRHAHFSLLPRPLMQAAKLGNARELHLSLNSGRWDFAHWGEPVVPARTPVMARQQGRTTGRTSSQAGAGGTFGGSVGGAPARGEWAVGSGAEMWALIEDDAGGAGSQEADVSADEAPIANFISKTLGLPGAEPAVRERSTRIMTSWRRLTASLAGLFCAALDALDERLTVAPRHAYARPPTGRGSSRDAGDDVDATLLHAFLASERICTENLTPFLKLLPCKSSAGLAALLEPHALFEADFHGMNVHLARRDGGLAGDAPESWTMRLTFQAVFSPAVGVWAFQRDWSLKKLFGRQVERACPLASSSKIHVLRPAGDAGEASGDDARREEAWEGRPAYTLKPVQRSHVDAVERAERLAEGYAADEAEADEDAATRERRSARRAYRSAQVLRSEGEVTYDLARLASDYGGVLDVELKWPGETVFKYPKRYTLPSVRASRQLVGAGQERGRLDLVLRNDDPSRESRVLYFETLPWFLQPHLHTLQASVQPDEFDDESDQIVRYADDVTAPVVLNVSYSAGVARSRPWSMEALVRVPPASEVRLGLEFRKAFLRYTEHPPDAHRGFDIAPAVVWLLDEASEATPETPRIYTEPALTELAVPDFSMPYNVIIFTSTIVALCLGSALNNLVREYKDVVT